ncbi:hypothetical protein KIPB_008820, partial [Kipferlia bialata]|eukprot:g8820.t1
MSPHSSDDDEELEALVSLAPTKKEGRRHHRRHHRERDSDETPEEKKERRERRERRKEREREREARGESKSSRRDKDKDEDKERRKKHRKKRSKEKEREREQELVPVIHMPIPFDTVVPTDFESKTTVGIGTFGRVKLVKYKPSGEVYVLKIMNKRRLIALRQLTHITAEKDILKMVKNPFISKLHGTFSDEEHIYMCFEFVPGGELFHHLKVNGSFPLEVVKFYAAELVIVLGYLHSLNVCYRDLKPENILLAADGHLKLTDFGFAKLVTHKTYTQTGTPEYIAPEIINNTGHNKAVDWWSLGILIYE